MKKILLFMMVLGVSILLVVSFTFFGCKGEAAEEAPVEGEAAEETGEVVLNVLLMSQSGYTEEDCRNISDEFEEKNPNVKVNLTHVAYESLHDKIVTAFASGEGGYDVVLVDTPWPAEFASAGFLLDITDKVTDEMKEDVWAASFKAGMWKDRCYALPWLNDIPYFYYNEKMLKEAGFNEPPKTWSELIEQSKVLKEKGIVEYPYVEAWPQTEELVVQYTLYLNAFGGQYLDEDLNPVFNKSEGKGLETLEWMIEGLKEGCINPASIELHYDDQRNILSQGKAAFSLGWTYMWGLLNDPDESNVVGDIKVGLIPGEVAKSVTVNGGMNLGISSRTKYPDEAWKYIEYMSCKDVQRRYAQNSLPIWMSLYDDPLVIETQPEMVEISKEQYKYLVNRPIAPWYEEFSRSIQIEVHNALLDEKTPQGAIDDIAAKVLELKEKYGQ